MKERKGMIVFIILLIIILIGGYFGIKYAKSTKDNNEDKNVILPQEEITDEQYRQTIVSLYFPDKETNELTPEARLIDIKELLKLPYETLVKLLIEGPKNEKLKSIIPKDSKVLKTYIEGECLTIDLSKEFLEYNKEDKNIIVKSLVNTLTELTEVNKVKILIEGEINTELVEIYERENNINE